jgi:hypothetical protein
LLKCPVGGCDAMMIEEEMVDLVSHEDWKR